MSATTPQVPVVRRTFTQLLSSTRRGARLARLLAAEQCRTWEVAPTITERVVQIVAELAANAALHGRVQGRDFRLALTFNTTADTLRVAVSDARGDHLPVPVATARPDEAESGRGLLLVTTLADRWGTEPYPPAGKTVWAEVSHQRSELPNATGATVQLASIQFYSLIGVPRDTAPWKTGCGGPLG
ncbi:ATP-binding protein [Streptomyces cadmiisoli]|uniref:ATP-binding protein n=1 Tax=Streptomyces cadmiisoli TaxID=2184053 RepID=A0A2Z4J3R4_9ACTN|nr:ATP-binding protein [Streptomyces cadmiisoli]